ncbi:rhomboid family intramembrane serine protease [Psychromonas algicola]|uniref:rhomboid family intramembrane serine protease n=1 Tax=Psychromonas algicola TaxID=2555642 RepID=UPI001067E81C|nr:rhomboid family intramembrane serine protease [Psychromonas sp. RZ5]TEW51282.1 rhomboid family intramembrane serine protease [Psychromonas sp. RZ5]
MQRYFKPLKHSVIIILLCVVFLLLNIIFPVNRLGIAPREMSHFSGIFFSPFLHVDWMHLLANSLPFIVLSSLIGLHSLTRFWLVFCLSVVSSGLLVWLFARGGTIHIGMSGVIYAMWGYLIVYGFKQRQFRDILISILVLFLYGGLVFGVLPQEANVSYESHFFGALVGCFLGYFFAKRPQ